jgi:LuxR family maltose regulon positive regulatory protein
MATWQVRTWLAQDNLDEPSQWAKERGLNIDFESPQSIEIDFFSMFDYIILARIWMAQGQLEKTIKLLGHLFVIAGNGGRTANMIEILMLQALAFQEQGDANQAFDALERSFALAEPKGFIRIFVDEGPPMARLLYEALSNGNASDYVQRLLSAFPDEDNARSTSPQPASSTTDLIEPLSERELEILQLLAEGLSNQEIGSQLYLSLNTVKAHTRNIYGKLGVNSRIQAAARARALGILSRNL